MKEGQAPLDSAAQVRTRWEEIKAVERTTGGGSATAKTLLSGIVPAIIGMRLKTTEALRSM